MNAAVLYFAQALFWIALMAGVGLAARPLINKIDDKGDRR